MARMFPDHHQQQCCAGGGGGGGEVFKVNRQEAYIVVVAACTACTAYTHSFIVHKAFGQCVKSRHVNVLNIYAHLMQNQVQGEEELGQNRHNFHKKE